MFDPRDDAWGGPGLDGGVIDGLGGSNGGGAGSRVGAEDQGVTCLEAEEGLEDGSGGWVGRGMKSLDQGG